MLVSALEGHRLWASTYDTAPNPLLALESRLLPEVVGPFASKRIVDVACGTGRWMRRMEAEGASVAGVDFCEEMACQVGGRVALGDAARLPFAPAIADITICCLAIGYFRDLDCVVGEMARITRRGGRVIISELDPAAVAAGWTRSFRTGGVRYEMEHSAWSTQRIGAAARHAGLHAETQRQAPFGEPERGTFLAAGKGGAFEAYTRIPALWIGSWRKI